MPIGVRSYVFEDSGAVKHVPRRVIQGLYADEDAIPEYAGTRQRVAEVVVENENGKPIRILDARGHFWTFDEAGHLKRDPPNFHFGPHRPKDQDGKVVVDLRPKLEEKQWLAKHRWDLTKDDIDSLTLAIWPQAAPEIGRVGSVKGSAPRVPAMTNAGREALTKMFGAVHDISESLGDLSEAALKGLIYETQRIGRMYNEQVPIWDGIAAHIEKVREIRARHRSGKGTWYAVVNVLLWNDEHTDGRSIETFHRACNGKAAAVEAARELLAESARHFDENVTLEAEVRSDLEWAPPLPE
jgi:hypothetical protein